MCTLFAIPKEFESCNFFGHVMQHFFRPKTLKTPFVYWIFSKNPKNFSSKTPPSSILSFAGAADLARSRLVFMWYELYDIKIGINFQMHQFNNHWCDQWNSRYDVHFQFSVHFWLIQVGRSTNRCVTWLWDRRRLGSRPNMIASKSRST